LPAIRESGGEAYEGKPRAGLNHVFAGQCGVCSTLKICVVRTTSVEDWLSRSLKRKSKKGTKDKKKDPEGIRASVRRSKMQQQVIEEDR